MAECDVQEMSERTVQAVERAKATVAVSIYLKDLRDQKISFDATKMRSMVEEEMQTKFLQSRRRG